MLAGQKGTGKPVQRGCESRGNIPQSSEQSQTCRAHNICVCCRNCWVDGCWAYRGKKKAEKLEKCTPSGFSSLEVHWNSKTLLIKPQSDFMVFPFSFSYFFRIYLLYCSDKYIFIITFCLFTSLDILNAIHHQPDDSKFLFLCIFKFVLISP